MRLRTTARNALQLTHLQDSHLPHSPGQGGFPGLSKSYMFSFSIGGLGEARPNSKY